MPLISEFPIAGPQGKQGPVGPEGKQGPEGKRGPMGPAGPGTGDMLAMVYDPQGKAIDVYKYTDDAAAGRADLTLSNLSNYQKALAAIGGKPRDNLLDNAYFKGGGSQQGGGQFPINQRGQTSYTNVNSTMYGIDMWILDWNMTLTLVSGYVSMNGGGIFQPLPNEKISLITGKTVTLSALDAYGNLSVVTGVYDGVNHIISSDESVGIRINYGGKTAIFRVGRNSVVACKLELGDHQTLAYQDEDGNWQLFETPDYGEELEKCQRYLLQLNPLKLQIPTIGQGVKGPSSWYAQIPLPKEMRVFPSFSYSGGTLYCESQDGAAEISSLTPVSCTSNFLIMTIAWASASPTTAQIGTLYLYGTGSGESAPSVILSAEL